MQSSPVDKEQLKMYESTEKSGSIPSPLEAVLLIFRSWIETF
jgi:hypothetical protein